MEQHVPELMGDDKPATPRLGNIVTESDDAAISEPKESAVRSGQGFVPDDRTLREGDFLGEDLGRV
jgi:hypothetical protein